MGSTDQTTTHPKISIVTPSFNQGKFLEKTIISVLEQGYPNLEYIIIDGGSSDESVEVIKKYADRLAYWVSEPDRGQSHAINKGFERATGEIFGWLNSDDWYHPGALQAVAEAFAANPDAGALVGAGEMLYEENGQSLQVESFPVTVESLYGFVDRYFCQPSCFFTAPAWQQCGPLDETLHLAMDLDLWFRIAKKYLFLNVGQNLSVSLVHGSAKTTALAAQSMVDACLIIMRHGGEKEGRQRLVRFVEELVTLHRAHKTVDYLQEAVAARDQWLVDRDRQIAEQHHWLSETQKTVEELSRRIEGCDRQLEERARQIENLTSSLSWRISAPVRLLGDVVRNIFDGTYLRSCISAIRLLSGRMPHYEAACESLAPAIFMTTHVKFYPPAAGNEIRINNLLLHLKEGGYRIALLYCPLDGVFFSPEEVDHITHHFVDYLYQLPVSERNVNGVMARIFRYVAAAREPVIRRWRGMESAFFPYGAMVRAAAIIKEFRPDIIIAQYIWTSRLLTFAPKSVLKVIDLHDKFSDKEKKVCVHGVQDALTPTEEEEIAFINRADLAMAIQNNEADSFRKLRTKAHIITTGLDFAAIAPETAGEDDEQLVLIVASGNPLNVRSVQHFIDNVWGKVVAAVPSATLRIVGGVCSAVECRQLSDVELVGFVADLEPEYAAAAVVINPVVAGTGLKIKSLEALAHGKPLVSTPAGVEGLPSADGELFLVGGDDDKFAAGIRMLLDDKQLRCRFRDSALAFARNELVADKVYASLDAALQAHVLKRKKIRVLCLYLRYGTDHYREGLSVLEAWHRDHLRRSSVTTWIIDNKLEGQVDAVDASGYRVLAGDNSGREFSGWQRVLDDYAGEIAAGYDVVHFVTEKFNTLYTGYLNHFREDSLTDVCRLPVCLGHIDCYDEPIRLKDTASQHWIRTCFFFLSTKILPRLERLTSFSERKIFFDESGTFSAGAPLSANYQNYITGWLSGEELQGVAWHSRIVDPVQFQEKALAILNEHMFGINLRRSGIGLVDFCWMYYRAGKDDHELLAVPLEEQIDFRRTVLEGSIPS